MLYKLLTALSLLLVDRAAAVCWCAILQAADFRKGYGNWRSKKSKGARGETGYLLDKEKLHATDVQHEDVSF